MFPRRISLVRIQPWGLFLPLGTGLVLGTAVVAVPESGHHHTQ